MMEKPIKFGMVGGGPDAFIGQIHRMAAAIDGRLQLVCGVFSRDAQKNKQAAGALSLDESRVYPDFEQMMRAEAELPESERMQFVSIVTPNNSHHAITLAALKHGFHVFCEKPATTTTEEIDDIARLVRSTGLKYAIAHTYTGYPMVQEARQRVADGEIGAICKVYVQYTQGWLAGVMQANESKQASWRLNPDQAGSSCCIGDIGVHAANLAEFITSSDISSVLADLGSVEPAHQLDDDAAVLLRFNNGARGILNASQICVGEENNLKIQVHGSRGSLHWSQQEPNTLIIQYADKPATQLRAGWSYLHEHTQLGVRTPAGHPEGYIEAFANLYRQFADLLCESTHSQSNKALPQVKAAVQGMRFIQACVDSHEQGNRWTAISNKETM